MLTILPNTVTLIMPTTSHPLAEPIVGSELFSFHLLVLLFLTSKYHRQHEFGIAIHVKTLEAANVKISRVCARALPPVSSFTSGVT